MKHLGILGGSFDPPHRAHLDMAALAMDQIPLEAVYFVPAYQAPLKEYPPVTSPRHRLAMLRLALEAKPAWQVISWELEQQRPVATVETLQHLQSSARGTHFHLLIGGDQAASFHRWQSWERLLEMAEVVWFTRAGYDAVPELARTGREIALETDISSTTIRSRLADGKEVSGLLPPGVLDYINAEGLYGC